VRCACSRFPAWPLGREGIETSSRSLCSVLLRVTAPGPTRTVSVDGSKTASRLSRRDMNDQEVSLGCQHIQEERTGSQDGQVEPDHWISRLPREPGPPSSTACCVLARSLALQHISTTEPQLTCSLAISSATFPPPG